MPKDVSLSVFSVGWAGELATQCAWRPPPPPPSPSPPCCSPSPPSPSCWSLQRQAPILTSRGSDGETAMSTFTLRFLHTEAMQSQFNIFCNVNFYFKVVPKRSNAKSRQHVLHSVNNQFLLVPSFWTSKIQMVIMNILQDMTNADRRVMRNMMRMIEQRTCLRFREQRGPLVG